MRLSPGDRRGGRALAGPPARGGVYAGPLGPGAGGLPRGPEGTPGQVTGAYPGARAPEGGRERAVANLKTNKNPGGRGGKSGPVGPGDFPGWGGEKGGTGVNHSKQRWREVGRRERRRGGERFLGGRREREETGQKPPMRGRSKRKKARGTKRLGIGPGRKETPRIFSPIEGPF